MQIAVQTSDHAAAALVADLHASGLKKQTIRKTVNVLAMALDHARIQPNPARDRLTVKLPREERRHVEPPTAAHVEAVIRLLPRRYRLAPLVLDATGIRVGELDALLCGQRSHGPARRAGFRLSRPSVRGRGGA
ncbi:MAG: hypothetical protein H0U03_10870 [Actinobacteria bacterium]|nr:hypothetical protein [Actinomycetota bacterium]